MRTMCFILADMEVENVLVHWQGLSAGTREGLIVVGAAVLVAVGVTVWVVFSRKSRRRRHRHHHNHPDSHEQAKAAEAADQDGAPSGSRKRRKWRRPRREHRLRNPTLAETGGLPPVRTGGPPDIQP